MSGRPPYLSPGLARRRQRRRGPIGAGAALLAVILVAALVVVRHSHDDNATRPAKATGGDGQTPLQLANGPVTNTPGPRPLAVKLDGTRDTVHLRFGHPPRSGLMFDLDTGQVLWRHAPERVLPIASVTKMMTALVVVSREPPDTMVRITKEALAYKGSGVGVLPRGKRVKLETLLNGLLLPSGNDAAIALAQRVSGTVRNFVTQMNARAAEMGLRCTHYTSPDGFVDAGNHSCAVDLAAEARAVLDQPRLARIVRRRKAVEPFPIKGGKLFLYNNNPLLLQGYPGTIGIKTGFTDKAGRCLVAAARRNGRRLGVILLNSPDTGGQATKLLNRGFASVHA
jgi:D-alanyl-D-alanine carboxypeptidase (penicillin-binding protein 5/6)